MKIQQIYHKKNELFKVEFYKDEECTEAFDFTNAKNLYIELKDGDIMPLLELHDNIHNDDVNVCVANITAFQILQFGKYICGSDEINGQGYGSPQSDTKYYFLNVSDYDEVFEGYYFDNFTNITPNLSKYIPEGNAALFLSEEDRNQYDYNDNLKFRIVCQDSIIPDSWKLLADKSSEITIFLPHGTQSKLQKAEEVTKELKEKYGVEEVNLVALHFFVEKKHIIKTLRPSRADRMYNNEIYGYEMQKICKNINKIITTNSTGILKPEDSNECLQVIDCKEIFKEHLKEKYAKKN